MSIEIKENNEMSEMEILASQLKIARNRKEGRAALKGMLKLTVKNGLVNLNNDIRMKIAMKKHGLI